MAQSFLHGNGGSLRINCKVICSTADPPKKGNNIWVKTSIPLGVVLISPTTPTGTGNAEKGNVWIQDASSRWVEPNFNFTNSKKIGMRCFPGLTYQHDGTKWVKKDAYIWYKSKWTQISWEFSATIKVTYPAGSTLTCSNGSTTLTATSTSGEYTFTVTKSGEWTVTAAASSTQSASKTVKIESDGDSANVALAYNVTLVNSSGQLQGSPKTKQFSDNSYPPSFTFNQQSSYWRINVTGNSDYGGYGAVYFDNIDMSNYKTLTLTAAVAGGGSTYYVAIYKTIPSKFEGSSPTARVTLEKNTKSTVKIDVTGLSGTYCVAIIPHITMSSTCDVYSLIIA